MYSKNIPGKTSSQCCNYWKKLIKSGKIEDPNYYFENKGKLKFRKNIMPLQLNKKNDKKSLTLIKKYNNFTRYSFKVLQDNTGVFGSLPKTHPKAPSAAFIKNVISSTDKKQT